jgi:hypothetical protein
MTRVAALATTFVLFAVGATGCAKTGGSTADEAPDEPPATAVDGAPVFRVPVDAEAAIGKAGLRVVGEDEPPLVHLRTHLDVIIDGHPVVVPKGIGMVDPTHWSPLTTRDDSGVLYVASPKKETFRLGQLFQQWNVPLDKDCISGRCASKNPDKQLLAYVNGELAVDPSTIQLTDGAEIVVWFGPRDTNPTVPTSYNFPAATTNG